MEQQKNQNPAQQLREKCRKQEFAQPTAGQARGHVQANVVIIPVQYANDFKKYCELNPKPCPLIEDYPGFFSQKLAPNSDIRTDLPRYRVWKNGEFVEEVLDASKVLEEYQDTKFHTFLIGCSFTFENGLQDAGLEIRHISEKRNVPMYSTNIEAKPSGPFSGYYAVSMRPFKQELVEKVQQISEEYPTQHGGPIHIGDPEKIGIKDINKPDYGDSVTIHQNEIPMFWGCGITPQLALKNAKLPIVITHAPGCMYVCDALESSYRIKK